MVLCEKEPCLEKRGNSLSNYIVKHPLRLYNEVLHLVEEGSLAGAMYLGIVEFGCELEKRNKIVEQP